MTLESGKNVITAAMTALDVAGHMWAEFLKAEGDDVKR